MTEKLFQNKKYLDATHKKYRKQFLLSNSNIFFKMIYVSVKVTKPKKFNALASLKNTSLE